MRSFGRTAWLGRFFRWRADLLLLLAVLLALFSGLSGQFASGANFISILNQAAPLAVAAIGQTFVIAGGGLDISVGSVAAACAILGSLAAVRGGAPAGMLVFLAVGVLLGSVNGAVVARFRVQPVIATIAMMTFARGLAFEVSGGQPVSGLPALFTSIGWGSWLGIPLMVWIALLLVAVAHVALTSTTFGTYVRAAGSAADALRLGGVHADGYRWLSYVVSGGAVAFAAILFTAQAGSGQPNLGVGLELQTIAASVIGGTSLGGGRGSVLGAAGGALVMTILADGMVMVGVTPYVQQVVLGVAMILAVVWDYALRRWMRERVGEGVA
ncbi:MAG: ABC transporter permease [Firmicutes bacterium]|nr:ABC transporter permease [Bacillota bacterium]